MNACLTRRRQMRSLEALEPRRLFVTMVLDGTIGDDTIMLSVAGGTVTGTVNGTPFTNTDANVTAVVINAGDGADTITLESSTNNPVTVNGDGGNDTIRLTPTSHNLSQVNGAMVSIVGGLGDDAIIADDASGALGRFYVFRDNRFQLTESATIRFQHQSTESLEFRGSDAASITSITLDTIGLNLNLNAGGGNDNVGVNFNHATATTTNLLTVNCGGNGFFDQFSVTDQNNTLDHDYSITGSTITGERFLGGIAYSGAGQVFFTSGAGANEVTVDTNLAGITNVDTRAGDDHLLVKGSKPARLESVRYISGQGEDDLTVDPSLGTLGSATVIIEGVGNPSQDFGDVRVLGNGILYNGVETLLAKSLEVGPAAKMDVGLTTSAIIVDYTGASPFADIRDDIFAGKANNWAGPGIVSESIPSDSTRSIGYSEATDMFSTFPAMVNGVAVDDSTVVIRYTRAGDANLDRFTDLSDFARLAANFNVSPSDWSRGDFNYDGVTDIGDFALLALNYDTSARAPIGTSPAGRPLAAAAGFAGGRIFADVEI